RPRPRARGPDVVGGRNMTMRLCLSLALVVGAVVLGSQPPTEPQPPAAEKPAEKPAQAPTGEQPAASAPAQPPKAEPPPPLAATESSEPREAIVLLKDGQRYRGMLVSRDEDKVVLKIAGIDTPIPSGQIERVMVLKPVLEQYRSMRSA